MKITITSSNDGITVKAEKTQPDERASYDNVLAMLIGSVDAFTREFLSDLPFKVEDGFDEEAFREATYDKLDAVFGRLLKEVFPEIDPEEFDLSAAAIVYASDQIIDQAVKEGRSWEDVKKEYEDKALEYINARKVC